MHWDLFCRVVDNFGDIGVCWRLAADLATRGDAVRLWCDDASALAWMAPDGAPGVDGLPLGDGMPPEGDCGALGLDVGGGGVDWLLEELLWLWHPARASASASVTARATS